MCRRQINKTVLKIRSLVHRQIIKFFLIFRPTQLDCIKNHIKGHRDIKINGILKVYGSVIKIESPEWK